jgi:hypothetical protein
MAKKRLSKDYGLSTMPGLALREKYLTKKQKALKKAEHNPFQTEQDVDKYLKEGKFALLTGHKKDKLSPEESEQKHNDLIADLEAAGHRWQHVGGKWLGGEAEPTVMVHDISPEEASNFAKKYNQQAHIQSNTGFHKEHSHDPKHNPPEGGSGHIIGDHIEDNYSEITLPNGKKVRFQLNVGYPMSKSIKSPSKHIGWKRLQQIKQDNYIGEGGQEYDEGELDQSLIERKMAEAERMVQQADRMQRVDPTQGQGTPAPSLTPSKYFKKMLKKKENNFDVSFLQKADPEDESVDVSLGLNRHRALRELLESHPEGKLHKRKLESLGHDLKSLGLSKYLDGQGNLHHSRVSEFINNSPKMKFGISHTTYGEPLEAMDSESEEEQQLDEHMDAFDPADYGVYRSNYPSVNQYRDDIENAKEEHRNNFKYTPKKSTAYEDAYDEQRHSVEPSQVFQLNYTPEHEKQLKQAGVFNTFQEMLNASKNSGHPVSDKTLGWARYTKGKDGNVHIDEIQSDFGQSFVKQGAAQIKQAMSPEGFNANGQIIRMSPQEGQNYLKKLKEKYPDEHFNTISKILFNQNNPNEVIHESLLQHLRNKGHVGKQVHIWDAESKAGISGMDLNKPIPAHMQQTYKQSLPKLGYKSGGRYGDIETQTSPILALKNTHTQKLTKKQKLIGSFMKKSANYFKTLLAKFESLEKASKNVREQRQKLFGIQGNPSSKSPFGQKQIEQHKKFGLKRYGKEIVTSKGKINQKTGERKKGAIEGVSKPDWRSKELEVQWNPGAITHEFAHLEQMPEGRTPSQHQTIMDKEVGEASKLKGSPFRHRSEVQARAAENKLRARMGLPKLTTHVKIKEGARERKVLVTGEPAAVRYKDKKGQLVDQLKAGKLLSPEMKERTEMIDTGELKYSPEKDTWVPGTSIDAKINRRARLAAKNGPNSYFKSLLQKPEKLAASEKEMKKEELVGGKGDKKDIKSFDEKEVKMGLQVEMEHTNDKKTAEEIVADHLSEDAKYYSKLKQANLADELKKEKDLNKARVDEKVKSAIRSAGGSQEDYERAIKDIRTERKPAIAEGVHEDKETFLQNKDAKKEAKRVLGESKKIKPNLPKSEEDMEKKDKPFHGYNPKKHAKTGGLNDKERERINREEGRDLKRPQPEGGSRKKSFCARMSGVKGPTSKEGKLTPKGAALKRWKCSKEEQDIEKRCWEGYKPVPGKKPYSKGSCAPIKKSDEPPAFKPVNVAGVDLPLELHDHYHSGQVVPYDHKNRETAVKFVTDVWRRNRVEGERMSSKLLGIGPKLKE